MRTWEILKEPEKVGNLENLPVGTLLCVEDDDEAEILLVGDVNVLGGTCDDCPERRPVVAIMLPEG